MAYPRLDVTSLALYAIGLRQLSMGRITRALKQKAVGVWGSHRPGDLWSNGSEMVTVKTNCPAVTGKSVCVRPALSRFV